LDANPKTVAGDSNCQQDLGDASRFQNDFLEVVEDGEISSSLDEKTLSEKERVPLQILLPRLPCKA
jgi:hypothetical protein